MAIIIIVIIIFIIRFFFQVRTRINDIRAFKFFYFDF